MPYLLQAAIPYFSGLPEDVCVNTFHFNWLDGSPPESADYTAMANMVANWYETIFDNATDAAMAGWSRPDQTRMKIYNVDDPEPRVPLFDAVVPMTVQQQINGFTAPEVAIVVSIHGGFLSGESAASRRGRVFLGCLGSVVAQSTLTAFPRPNAAVIENIIAANEAMVAVAATTNWRWVVYSRKNDSTVPVIGGWVDNTLDTQRRRGVGATARNAWGSLTPP